VADSGIGEKVIALVSRNDDLEALVAAWPRLSSGARRRVIEAVMAEVGDAKLRPPDTDQDNNADPSAGL
jgi:hypothetical protein